MPETDQLSLKTRDLSLPSAQDIYARVAAFNSQTPPKGALSLWLNGHRAGVLLPEPQRMIASSSLAHQFVRTSRGIEVVEKDNLNAVLAGMAKTFHEAGFFFQWRNELLDVRDLDTDEVFAQAERGLFRFFGMATHAVYAIGTLDSLNRPPRVFLCQRSFTKQVDPGLWDALAAGLISAGESPQTSLPRETREEAGLEPADYTILSGFKRIAVRRVVEEGWMHEDAFCARVSVKDATRVHNLDGEVIAVELVDFPELIKRIGERRVPSDTALAFFSLLDLS